MNESIKQKLRNGLSDTLAKLKSPRRLLVLSPGVLPVGVFLLSLGDSLHGVGMRTLAVLLLTPLAIIASILLNKFLPRRESLGDMTIVELLCAEIKDDLLENENILGFYAPKSDYPVFADGKRVAGQSDDEARREEVRHLIGVYLTPDDEGEYTEDHFKVVLPLNGHDEAKVKDLSKYVKSTLGLPIAPEVVDDGDHYTVTLQCHRKKLRDSLLQTTFGIEMFEED